MAPYVRCALISIVFCGCGPKDVIPSGANHPATASAPAATSDPAAAEQAAIAKAMPIFRKYCSGCHASDGAKATKQKLGHFDMTTYPFGGQHAAKLGPTIRTVLGLTGEKPTMPANDPGAVKGEELDIIRAWTEAFDRTHAPADPDGHDGHDGHHGHH
jgi:mono/diheme cytochrome c family protein